MATDERTRSANEQLVSELDDMARRARALVTERRVRDGDDAVELTDYWFATWETLRARLRFDVLVEHNDRGVETGTRTRYVTEWRRS